MQYAMRLKWCPSIGFRMMTYKNIRRNHCWTIAEWRAIVSTLDMQIWMKNTLFHFNRIEQLSSY